MLGCVIPGLRWVTLLSGLVECLCFTGIDMGWPSLVFILKADGYYGELCRNTTGPDSSIIIDCSAQDAQLSLVITIAVIAKCALLFPMGIFFDKFGTTAARILVISILTAGCLMLAFSSTELPFLIFPALICIASGGLSLYLTNIQTANLFGAHQSLVSTLQVGLQMGSPGIVIVIKVLYERGISLRSSFLFMSACSVIHILRTFLLLPKTHIPYPLHENYTYGMNSCGKSRSTEQEGTETTEANGHVQRKRKREVTPSLSGDPQPPQSSEVDGRSFRTCVFSRLYLSHMFWFTVCSFNIFFVYASLYSLITQLADGDSILVSMYTNAFGFAQLCGILCAPWNGLILQRNKGKQRAPGETEKEADLRSSTLSLFITSLLCLLFSICASIPVLPLQYLTFALQVVGVTFVITGNLVFINIAFPPRHFGKLYGLVSLVSTFLIMIHYPLMMLILDILEGNPLYVYIGISLLTLLAFIHPFYVFLHCRRAAQQKLFKPLLRNYRFHVTPAPEGWANIQELGLPGECRASFLSENLLEKVGMASI